MSLRVVSGWTELWEALAASPVSVSLREATWAYPALETIHLIGIAILVGPIMIFDMRILGLRGHLPVAATHELLLPWVWIGFGLNAVSGLLLFASDAAEFAANPAFAAKMALIALAGLNAVFFQWRYRELVAAAALRGSLAEPAVPAGAKGQAAISILIWLCVVAAGRLIAYTG
ncbi:MAG: DUF6644 family protein [Hyphomicrobiaceae bacterium]|nr:DUF6644 family protein [Hyphomicrobiaceae bacterium]